VKLDTRWLDWQSPSEKFEKGANPSPSKPSKIISGGFEGTESSKIPNFFSLEAAPEAYEDEFSRWVREQCVFLDRAWWGIGALHSAYFTWCEQTGRDVPGNLNTFKILLRDSGFAVTDDGLVYGLALVEDLRWQTSESAPSKTPKLMRGRR
jgi:hypothetical protein